MVIPARDIEENFGGGVSEGLPATGDYNFIGVGDIDKDGFQGLVVGAEENYGTLGTSGLYAFFGDGTGNWTQHTITTTGSYAAIEIRDADGDGYNEVFAGYQENTNGIGAWEWTGTQFDTNGISSPVTSGNVNYLRVENISGSSSKDIAVARNGGIKYFEGSGSSPISWTEYSTGLTTSGLCTSMDVNDLNNDGYMDIIAGQYGDGLFVHTQNPSGPPWNDETSTLPSVENSGRILGLVTGDVNNDGNVDLVYSRRTHPTGLFLLLGNGGGPSGDDLRWTYLNDSWSSRPSGSFYQMNLGDVDGDGDLDLLAAKENTGLHLYLGDGSEDPGDQFTWTEVTGKGLPADMKFFGSNYIDLDDDGDLDIAGCTWGDGIMVYENNEIKPQEPKAIAGRDVTVFLGEQVLMDGRNSSDAQDCPDGDINGDILTYDWNLTGQPSGSSLDDDDLLPSQNNAVVSFTPTHPGNYTFTLSVQDTEGHYSISEDDLRVSVILNNTPPVADAGEDRTVNCGDVVILNGTRSYDMEDSLEQLSFLWSVNSSNPDSVLFDDPANPEPSFTAPETPGKYRFTLVVADSFNYTSEPDQVNITVVVRPNVDPVANAGEDMEGIANSTISLDGTGSEDPDGEIVTWLWNCTSHEGVSISDGNSSKPSFMPNRSGVYSFSLRVVDDRGGVSEPDEVTVLITPDDLPPLANAGKNQTVNRNSTVYLNGSLSQDPEGGELLWHWESTSHPGIIIYNSGSPNPSFVANEIGEYHFRLRVQDDRGMWSDWDHVRVTVLEEDINITDPFENTLPEILLMGPEVGETVNGTITISWAASDADGDPLTIILELESITDPEVHILYSEHSHGGGSISLDTSSYENGTYGLRLTVSDGYDTVVREISPFEILNEEETVIVDDDDPGDEGNDEAPTQEDDGSNGINTQIVIALIVVLVFASLLVFGIGKNIYDRMDGGDLEE